MTLFDNRNRTKSEETHRVYAAYELAHTLVDFGAAFCFIIGSVFFFYDSLVRAGTWFFLIGSILFAAKPTLRLMREIKLLKMGRIAALAEREET
ncbi:YrhK family protein [uncultured Celeribacter sp.]|uniref:YrhK family protein n=1 Tax=uncultured Celeribacter sp. TaxID=1303376 RepID=UPI002AA817D7|nr:YrhK family protein [uncultured Celeribacter sp.]